MNTRWFISPRFRPGSKLALIAAGFALIVILLGAYTRLTNAGLSCPDWPHCYGYLTAPTTTTQIQGASAAFPGTPVDIKRAWTEMVHRYFAGTEALLILLLIGSIFLNGKAKEPRVILMGVALIALLTTQIMLGMFTVTEKLKPVIVTAHLLTGISILAALWWTYLDLHLMHAYFSRHTHQRIKPWLWLGLIVIACQIALGGWVSTHYASLACIDLPYCNGKLIPPMHFDQLNTDLITIHMLHRFGALITATVIGFLSFWLLRLKDYKALGGVLLSLVLIQLSLGILNILWLRPVYIALLHLSVAILLLLTMITAVVKAHVESRASSRP